MEFSKKLGVLVRSHYSLQVDNVERIPAGLINDTYLIHSGNDRYILQKISPLIPVGINEDINKVTQYLAKKNVKTVEILPTNTGDLYVTYENANWRLQSYIDGYTIDNIQSPRQAYSAGEILAEFHLNLLDFDYDIRCKRLGVHDTPHHMEILRQAVRSKSSHAEYGRVKLIADEIFAMADKLPDLPEVSHRIVHGDPKISNIVFTRNSNKAVCMIDLDCLNRMPLYLELGDAMRSWCNPIGEDSEAGEFSIDNFTAAIEAYASVTKDHIDGPEWRSIIPATHTIFIELASRFCADALNENYFGWNPANFESRSVHNQVRAMGQINAAKSFCRQLQKAEAVITENFLD